MESVLRQKVRVGISECCFGAGVRYNGKGFNFADQFGRDKSQFIFYPVCPECMAGLGVPRSPISIKGGTGVDVLQGKAMVKNREGTEVTQDVVDASKAAVKLLKKAGVYVFIYKEGSPSCGVYRTTMKDTRLGNPPGIFGAMLLEEGFFLIPGDELESPIKRWDIRRRLNAFVWLKELEIKNKKELYDVWHTLKFMCQEIDEKEARAIGPELSNLGEYDTERAEAFRTRILNILRKPSQVNRIKAWMWKNYSYYRKEKGIKLDIVKQPTDLRGNTALAEELIELERILYKEGYVFGSSPILNRSR